jgi:DNA-binding transcriptional regulator GbsR (MarR family)
VPSLESLMRHDGRVDLLACLVDGEPLAAPQLSAETGQSMTAVRHHLKLLGAFDLVEEKGVFGEEPRYTATLDDHPEWVREAVEERRRGQS